MIFTAIKLKTANEADEKKNSQELPWVRGWMESSTTCTKAPRGRNELKGPCSSLTQRILQFRFARLYANGHRLIVPPSDGRASPTECFSTTIFLRATGRVIFILGTYCKINCARGGKNDSFIKLVCERHLQDKTRHSEGKNFQKVRFC